MLDYPKIQTESGVGSASDYSRTPQLNLIPSTCVLLIKVLYTGKKRNRTNNQGNGNSERIQRFYAAALHSNDEEEKRKSSPQPESSLLVNGSIIIKILRRRTNLPSPSEKTTQWQLHIIEKLLLASFSHSFHFIHLFIRFCWYSRFRSLAPSSSCCCCCCYLLRLRGIL